MDLDLDFKNPDPSGSRNTELPPVKNTDSLYSYSNVQLKGKTKNHFAVEGLSGFFESLKFNWYVDYLGPTYLVCT